MTLVKVYFIKKSRRSSSKVKKERTTIKISVLSLFPVLFTFYALTLKFDKMNVSAVTPAPVSPPCEVCGVLGHIGVDCQLGSAIEGVEQMNYAQYNQGMRQNRNFYKTPQNSYGKIAPPSYANNQRVPQKSGLEILM